MQKKGVNSFNGKIIKGDKKFKNSMLNVSDDSNGLSGGDNFKLKGYENSNDFKLKSYAFLQIFLLVSFTFAISFVLNAGMVSGDQLEDEYGLTKNSEGVYVPKATKTTENVANGIPNFPLGANQYIDKLVRDAITPNTLQVPSENIRIYYGTQPPGSADLGRIYADDIVKDAIKVPSAPAGSGSAGSAGSGSASTIPSVDVNPTANDYSTIGSPNPIVPPATGSIASKLTSGFNSASGGVTKDVFFRGTTYKDVLVKNIGGKDVAILDNGAVLKFDKGGWGLVEGSTVAPHGYKLPLIGTQFTGGGAYLVEGVVWAAMAYGAGKMVGGLIGLDDKNTNALGISLAAAAFSYKGFLSLGKDGFNMAGKASKFFNAHAAPIAIGIGVAIFIAMYKKESKKLITFECLPWEPPLGGARCEECNKDSFRPCSEYRCKSLGQACEIVNAGSEEESCTWVNPKDVNSPTIQPSIVALKPVGDLSYVPDTTIRPPNRGVKIIDSSNANGGKCLKPFTPLEFGIKVNEPSQCKLGFDRNDTFETMRYYFGESNMYRYNHTQKMRLPTPDEDTLGAESPLLKNNGNMDLFVRCQDANGNVNEDAFIFTFCVDPSPDTTPPIIEGTSIIENGAVQFDVDSVPLSVYTNEPAECKWSRQSKDYDSMENSFGCDTNADSVNADLQYTCSGNLTGITNNANNKFYFRCKDTKGNTNVQSHPLTIRGTRPLNIISVSPNNETVTGSASVVPITLTVRTDDGADTGTALCYFSNSGVEGSYVPMFESNSFEHKQELDLISGSYNYYYRCVDAGGNSAETNVSFDVFVDTAAPNVVRAYKDLDALKIVTDEDAECVYSLNDCNYEFADGTNLIYSNSNFKNSHFVEWDPQKTYNIKCKDDIGNMPSPNSCSIIVNAFNVE